MLMRINQNIFLSLITYFIMQQKYAQLAFSKVLYYLELDQWRHPLLQNLLSALHQTAFRFPAAHSTANSSNEQIITLITRRITDILKKRKRVIVLDRAMQLSMKWTQKFGCQQYLNQDYFEYFELIRCILKVYSQLQKMNKADNQRQKKEIKIAIRSCKRKFKQVYTQLLKKHLKEIQQLQKNEDSDDEKDQLCICQTFCTDYPTLKHEIVGCSQEGCQNYFHPKCYRKNRKFQMRSCKYCELKQKTLIRLRAVNKVRANPDQVKTLFSYHMNQKVQHQKSIIHKIRLKPSQLLNIQKGKLELVASSIEANSNKLRWPRNVKVFMNSFKLVQKLSFPAVCPVNLKRKQLFRTIKRKNDFKIISSVIPKEQWHQNQLSSKRYLIAIYLIKKEEITLEENQLTRQRSRKRTEQLQRIKRRKCQFI